MAPRTSECNTVKVERKPCVSTKCNCDWLKNNESESKESKASSGPRDIYGLESFDRCVTGSSFRNEERKKVCPARRTFDLPQARP